MDVTLGLFPKLHKSLVHHLLAGLVCKVGLDTKFELGKLSSGKAAELADLSRVEFLEAYDRYMVSPFNYTPEEFEPEVIIRRGKR